MADDRQAEQKPLNPIEAHLREYMESGGRKGHIWRGYPTLLLTTTGRRTGQARITPLIYGQDGERLIVVASNAGRDHHPAWYLNLQASSIVQVQVGPRHLVARARRATPDEKPRLWALMTGIFPRYRRYQEETGRDIPVVILEPETSGMARERIDR